MSYIGAQPNKTLTKTTSQSFNGTGSATTFTLNRAVNTEEELEVFVENVQQEPGSGKSYTATGTTLTFDEAPPSGTGNIYVIYRGQAEVTTRLEHDANQALSATNGTFSGNLDVDGTTTVDGLTSSEALDVTTSTHANASVFKSTGHTQLFLQDTDASANDQFWGLQVSGGEFNILTCNDDRASGFVTPLNISQSGDVIFNSGGDVGIGTSTPDVTSDGTAARTFFAVQGTANRGVLNLGTSSSAGADVATINFNNGANSAASIVVDGVSGSTTNASMYFYTSGSNRMYIKSDGYIHMGDSKNYDSSVLNLASSGLTITNAATNGHFRQCYQSSNQHMYWSNGTNQAYLSSGGTWTDASDIAYKKDITDSTYGIDTVKALQPRFYYMKDDAIEDDSRQLGFIAQELEAVVPEVVSGDDGSKGVEYGHLTAVLAKALQEAVAKIETLETKVAALEGN